MYLNNLFNNSFVLRIFVTLLMFIGEGVIRNRLEKGSARSGVFSMRLLPGITKTKTNCKQNELYGSMDRNIYKNR